jgi:hypothetical protein
MGIASPKAESLESLRKESTHILWGIIFIQLDMIRHYLELATLLQRCSNGPFRSAGDEDAKAKIFGEKARPDSRQQFFPAFFTLTLI